MKKQIRPFIISTLLLGSFAPEIYAKKIDAENESISFDSIEVSISRNQRTSYSMIENKKAKSTAYDDLEKFTYSQKVKKGTVVPLEANLKIYSDFVEVEKKQNLPTGGKFLFGRQYYRGVSGRGFKLNKHEFDSYGQEVLKQSVRDFLKEEHAEISSRMFVREIQHSDYMCEPDFKSGFHCYYRFEVVGEVLVNDEMKASLNLPNEFRLNVEATDFYTQDDNILTGVETNFYKFDFSQVYKQLDQIVPAKEMTFDFINEDLIFLSGETRDIKTIDVMMGMLDEFKIEKFGYRSDDHAIELRKKLATKIKESGFIQKFNSTVKESYSNENVQCYDDKKSDADFVCDEIDRMSIQMDLKE